MDNQRQIATVGVLAVLACFVQVWMIDRAVVPAQDALRYLIVAQSMARDGLVATLEMQYEQPLYPALVWLTHAALAAAGLRGTADWAASLQWSAAASLVLAVAPLYFLLRLLHDSRSAVAGCLLFVLVGAMARLGADGLSDSTHLCLCLWALWAISVYFTSQSRQSGRHAPCAVTAEVEPHRQGGRRHEERACYVRTSVVATKESRRGAGWLLAAGLFCGLAILTRAEAIVLPAAFLATLALVQLRRPFRRPWAEAATAAVSLLGGMSLVLAVYLALSGALRPDSALERLLSRRGVVETEPLNATVRGGAFGAAVEERWYLDETGRLVFGRKDFASSSRFHGVRAATGHLIAELVESLQYWIGGLALFGLWRWRGRAAGPIDRFVQILCGGLIAATWAIAVRNGYLSDRHLLLVIVFALGWAGVGAVELGEALAAACWLKKVRLAPAAVRRLALAAVALACLPALARPLHASRINHREAAAWLAEHAAEDDVVLDSRGWTALYTGRPTYRYEAAQAAFSHPQLAYVVVEQAELEMASRRGETMRRLVAEAAEPVARFSVPGAKPQRDVVVHRWHPQRFRQLGDRLHAR